MIIYFVLLRFNLTNETYTEEMISNFPGASKSGMVEILFWSIYASWILILIDIFIVKCIYDFVVIKYLELIRNRFIIGFLLNIPIVILYASIMDINKTLIVSMLISSIIACLAYCYIEGDLNSNSNVIG